MTSGFLLHPAAGGSGSLADGDYGDVTVSGSGTVIDIDAGAVGNTELRDSFGISVIGRAVNSLGTPADIISGAADYVLRTNGAGTAIAWGTIATGGIADAAVTDAKLRDSAALSVIGNATSFAAAPTDVASGGADLVLLTNGAGTGLLFGQVAAGGIASNAVTTAKILNDNVTFAKMENILTDSLIGRDTAGTGDPENISLNATLSMTGGGALQRAALTGDVTASAGSNATTIANGVVTNAKLSSSGVINTTLHTEYFTDRKHIDLDTTAPSLAMSDPFINGGSDPENHVAGLVFNNGVTAWGRFGFAVPAGISGSDLIVKVCFLVNGAPGGGDAVDFDVVGMVFQDGTGASYTGSAVTVATVLDISGYGAAQYIIVDLDAAGVSLTAGDFVQGVIQRDATAGNASDTYADLIVLQWAQFNGTKLVIA